MNRTMLVLLLAVLSAPAGLFAQSIEFSCGEPVLQSNDHVGTEWEFHLIINGEEFPPGVPAVVPTKDQVTLSFLIRELEKYPDEGGGTIEIDTSSLEPEKEYVADLSIDVVEDRGRYADWVARWTVRISYMKVSG